MLAAATGGLGIWPSALVQLVHPSWKPQAGEAPGGRQRTVPPNSRLSPGLLTSHRLGQIVGHSDSTPVGRPNRHHAHQPPLLLTAAAAGAACRASLQGQRQKPTAKIPR